MAILAIVAAGCGLTIWTSVQLAETKVRLNALSARYAAQERLNAELMWQISQHTNLDHIQEQALSMGFEINYTNLYVSASTAEDLTALYGGSDPLVAQLPASTRRGVTGLQQPDSTSQPNTGGQMVSLQIRLERWLDQIQPASLWHKSWQQLGRWQQQASQFLLPGPSSEQERESIVVR